jgi:hypothetical protein
MGMGEVATIQRLTAFTFLKIKKLIGKIKKNVTSSAVRVGARRIHLLWGGLLLS